MTVGRQHRQIKKKDPMEVELTMYVSCVNEREKESLLQENHKQRKIVNMRGKIRGSPESKLKRVGGEEDRLERRGVRSES